MSAAAGARGPEVATPGGVRRWSRRVGLVAGRSWRWAQVVVKEAKADRWRFQVARAAVSQAAMVSA
ncbi:hypothetical protein [Nonomuraea sp. NPDC005650]|uniref:hypothetical protein n=1 Tax=Nonomuraea sp. NPDC005650 TaxID=3157045 RepID=UPI0033BF9FDC